MAYFAYTFMWVSTAAAVGVTVWITKEATPLWALFIPTLVSMKSSKNDKTIE